MHEEKRDESRVRLVRNHRRRIWKRVVSILACIVVFCTTYALILPAITLEKDGQGKAVPVCTFESLGIHKHTAACKDKDGNYVCGYADFVVHTHDKKCYGEDGKLWCPLPEIKAHTHSESCYAAQETEKPHTHTGKCYTEKRGKLTCKVPEGEGAHSHDERCYTKDGELTCKLEETDGHKHTDKCYEKRKVLICKLSTETAKEAPKKLACGKKEIILHKHEAKCYDKDGNLICGKTQVLEHQHGDGCFETVEETEKETTAAEKETADSKKETADNKKETADTKKPAASVKQDAKSQSSLKLQSGADSLKTLENGQGGETEAQQGENTDKKLPVTQITGSGTQYDAVNKNYKTELGIIFQFNTVDVNTDIEYDFQCPKEVIIPDKLLGENKTLYDNNKHKEAGSYRFERNSDGTYSIYVKMAPQYVQEAGSVIDGDIKFDGLLNCTTNEDGDIETSAGSGGVKIEIPSEQITYPNDESDKYNIDVSKSGEYKRDGDKLCYTVYIRSLKGTPDLIKFQDVLTTAGLDLGNPTVKVEKGTYQYFNQYTYSDRGDWEEVTVSPECQKDGTTSTISMDLTGLLKGTTKQQENGTSYIEAGCYRITYTYDLSGKNITKDTVKNKVVVSAKDNTSGQEVRDEATFPVSIDKRFTTTKTGAYQESTGRIQWTITVNQNNEDIAGALLTDKMLGQISEGTNVSVNPNNGCSLKNDDKGKITGIEFTGIGEEKKNTNAYTITYFTDAEKEWNETEIKNEAKFDPTPDNPANGDEIIGGATAKVPGTQLTKSYGNMTVSEDKKTAWIPWTITIEVPEDGLPADTIKDQIYKEYDGASRDQWLTWDQIKAMAVSMYWTNDQGVNGPLIDLDKGKITLTLKEPINGNTQVTFQQVSQDQALQAEKYMAFEIKLPSGLKAHNGFNKISCTYTTTVNLETANIGTTTYSNYVEVGDKKQEPKLYYHKGGVVKKDGGDKTGTTQTSSSGTLTWKIYVDVDDKDNKHLRVTDNLPNGVVLDSVSLTGGLSLNLAINENGSKYDISGSNNDYQITGSYDPVNGKITLDMSNKKADGFIQKNVQYIFTVVCHADGERLQEYAPGKTYIFTNNVSAETDNGELGSSNQTQEWTYQTQTVQENVINKTSVWKNDIRRLDYSIVINPKAEDLVPGTEVLTLLDELTCNMKGEACQPSGTKYQADVRAALIQNSVKLYKAVKNAAGQWIKGEEVRNWSWTYASNENMDQKLITHTITATGVPDSTSLIFEYAYSIDSAVEKGDTMYGLPLWNTARINGTSHLGGSGGGGKNWSDQDSSGQASTGKKYVFYKVEANNYGKILSGAKFSVYQCKKDGTYGDDVVKGYETNSDGMFGIEWLEDNTYKYNTLYKVKETSAPPGYKIPDEAPEFYFYFSKEGAESSLPEPLPESAVDLSKKSETVFVENIKNSTDITVKKTWQDKDGNPTVNNSAAVTVQLYQIASKEPWSSSGDSGEDSDVGGTATLTGSIKMDQNGGAWQDFSNREITYPSGTILTFSIIDNYGNKGEPVLSFNGESLKTNDVGTEEKEYWGQTYWAKIYNYSIKLESGVNELSGYIINWNHPDKVEENYEWVEFQATEPSSGGDNQSSGGEDQKPEGIPYGKPVIINKDNDWQYIFEDIPLSKKEEDGSITYYAYYIKEDKVTNYTPIYVNNDGITSGVITVINKADNVPSHELPETGGTGTTPYTMGGLLLMTAGLLLLYKRKKCGKEDVASF